MRTAARRCRRASGALVSAPRRRPVSPGRERRKGRLLHRAVQAAILLLLVFALDYLLYPLLSRPGGQSFNTGENGLWLRYRWYFGERSDQDMRRLAGRLRQEQIRYAYFHVRHITRAGTLRYHRLAQARRLVAVLRREAPRVKAIAWVFTGNARLASTGIGEVDLAKPAVRRAMVQEAQWLVIACGFDGVQWDYEIGANGDPDFLRLLRETRAALPPGKLLSAAVPMWLPRPFQRWGWSEAYFSQVAAACDQIAVMEYDSGIYLPRGYVWLVHQQAVRVTTAAARGNPRCRVLLGVPTYGRGMLSHNPWAENIRMALTGVRQGLADPRAHRDAFAGVAVFADYTTQPEEWATYRQLWLTPGRRTTGRPS